MTSYMVRVYPGPLAPSTVFIPVKIDETSTASDIARKVACQLDLKIQNPSLVEEIPNNQTILDPTDYPLDRYMLWPKQAKSGTVFITYDQHQGCPNQIGGTYIPGHRFASFA